MLHQIGVTSSGDNACMHVHTGAYCCVENMDMMLPANWRWWSDSPQASSPSSHPLHSYIYTRESSIIPAKYLPSSLFSPIQKICDSWKRVAFGRSIWFLQTLHAPSEDFFPLREPFLRFCRRVKICSEEKNEKCGESEMSVHGRVAIGANGMRMNCAIRWMLSNE